MIDCEDDIFTYVSDYIIGNSDLTDDNISGRAVDTTSVIPFITIVESDNTDRTSTFTFDNRQNHADVVYTVNVYTNGDTRKSDAKKYLSLADEVLHAIGFYRTSKFVIDNLRDNTIYRIVTTYRAVISNKNTIIK